MAVASPSTDKTDADQSMLPFLSSPSPTKETDPDANAASESSSIVSASESDLLIHRPKDAEIQSAELLRSEEYRLLFRLPTDEVLVQDFNCALQENILLQGHLYLFTHYICFYSNIFGFETKRIIAFHEITCVRKAKMAAIFHNAIEIVTGEKKHFFASFLSRDEAYRLIVDGWSQHGTNDQALLDCQESKSELGNQEVLALFESSKCLKEPDDNLNSGDRNDDASNSEESRCPSSKDGENSVSMKPSEVHENGVEENARCSPCRESLPWKLEDVDAPKIPEYYTMVSESRFQIRVEEFFKLFFSNDGIEFVETFHRRCGDKDFKCGTWYEHKEYGHARHVSFQHPIKLYLGAKFGHCQEVQKLRVYRNSHLVIETSQEVSDVPYGDYFCVEGLWDVEQEGNHENSCCTLRVYVHVAFSRKTMWKGKIEQSTIEECRESYAIWINNALELLKQKQEVAKSEGVASDAGSEKPEMPSDDYGLKERTKLSRSSEEAHDGRIPRNIQGASGSKDVWPSISNHVKRVLKIAVTSMASSLKEVWTTFSSFLKSQNNFPMMLAVALISILIIMQICIVVLLVRPPKVHLISQENFSSVNDRSGAVAWLEERVYQLKEEMLMVETRLERMGQEYILLKTRLQNLKHFETTP